MSEPIAEGWVNTREAAQLTGYTVAYMRQLAIKGRIEARRVGRDWLIERASLLEYRDRMDRLGAQRHDPRAPWREGEDV